MNKQFIHICVMCGRDFENNVRISYKCPKCEQKLVFLRKLEMIDKAEHKLLSISGKPKINIDLSKEVQTIRERCAKRIDRFSSVQEAMVAIQLEYQNVDYVSQKEINGKKVDFYLPDLKIILEIDGEIYHTDTEKELLRDSKIMYENKGEYEIVHIDAEAVPRYTWNLKEALPYVVKQRKQQKTFDNIYYDEYLLENFKYMELYKRRQNENARLLKSNREAWPYDTK